MTRYAIRDKEFRTISGRVRLYSQILKPIITARPQVTVNRIACTIEGVEMLISINMVGRAEVMLIKTLRMFITNKNFRKNQIKLFK